MNQSSQHDQELNRLLFGPLPDHRPLRFHRDSYAQGLLLAHLEELGFAYETVASLRLIEGDEELPGCRFISGDHSRYFQSYAADSGAALVDAALLALRACRSLEIRLEYQRLLATSG
jgi:hypothetical protein